MFPQRKVVLARELTKKFEEYLRGTPAELLASIQQRHLKGEFVVLIAPPTPAPRDQTAPPSDQLQLVPKARIS